MQVRFGPPLGEQELFALYTTHTITIVIINYKYMQVRFGPPLGEQELFALYTKLGFRLHSYVTFPADGACRLKNKKPTSSSQ